MKGALGKLDSQKVDQLCEFYTEFNPDTIRIQLSIMAECYHSFNQGEGVDTLHSVIDFLRKNSKIWLLIPKVLSLTKIVLVMPATNASSERAFSALRRVKSYLCTTMSNNCLNHLMICIVHKELVKKLSLKDVTNNFVDNVERRSSIFGKFSTQYYTYISNHCQYYYVLNARVSQ